MKKKTAFFTTLTLLVGTFSVSAFAAEEYKGAEKTVTVRIEGKNSTYFYDKVITSADNVADLMTEISEADNGVTVVNESGTYITQINDDVAGSIAPVYYDGWSDMINGISPMVGIAEQTIVDGDVIVFYYADEYGSHGFARPVMDTSKLDEGIISFTTDGYDSSYNPVTLPVEGATVTIGETTYVTDEEGIIRIDTATAAAGTYGISIEKVADDGMPLVLRFASDATITLPEYEKETEPDDELENGTEDKDAGDFNTSAVAGLLLAAGVAITMTGKKVRNRAYEK